MTTVDGAAVDVSPLNGQAAASLLKRWALEAGFDRAGIAHLAPVERAAVLEAWLTRGDQAGMGWMAAKPEVRREPERVLPGARSALCVALQYSPQLDQEGVREGEPEGDLWPRVARYARGRDYHELMGGRLAALADRVREEFPGADARPYVDTGPVLERELAARAGLGSIGKHTNLLSRDAGSWFLLGELFLTLDLAPDLAPGAPVTDLCGRCTRCLDACPTGALPEPYRLDSNRCISYWTIEHRGALPEEAREMVGDWVFGCDVCQEVCPWNRKAAPATDPELALPPERAGLDLAGLLLLARDEYTERFRGSPMKRAKLSGLKRNAAVAMGNRGDSRYLPALRQALDDEAEDPVVREHAAWAIEKIEARREG